jgi:hypothetical protein
MKYEEIAGECGVCGQIDDFADIQTAIRFRVVTDDGEVQYVCVRCAADSFNIEEAKKMLAEFGLA